MKRIAFILLSLLLVVIISGCGSPDQSVKMFLKYRINNDITAVKLYCTEDVEDQLDNGELTLGYLGFQEAFGAHVSWGNVKSQISLREIKRTTDEVEIAMGSAFGDVIFKLVHTGGMWKIDNIDGIKGLPTGDQEVPDETLPEEDAVVPPD